MMGNILYVDAYPRHLPNFNWIIEVVCFASGRTSLLRHPYPEKRQLTNCWHFSATNVAIYYIIKEIYKNRSKLRRCSAKVGRQKAPSPKK